MTFTVDNASDNKVSITIGQYPAVPIPARSQMSFGIEEGTNKLLLTKQEEEGAPGLSRCLSGSH